VTATGPSTITVSFSASVASTNVELVAQEFATSLGSSTVWSADTAGGQSNSSSTTVAFPSLTPTGSSELYAGYADVATVGQAGTTGGYAYYPSVNGNLYIDSPNVSAASAPSGVALSVSMT
jgi:hypothetical protein